MILDKKGEFKMKKMTREELIDFMVEDELDTMSMEDLTYNFEYAMKHGTRGYSEYSNEELENAYALAMDEEVQIVEVIEFDSAEEIARYVYEELTKLELIRLMNNTRIFNNDVGEYVIDILLKENSRVRRTSRGKYQFIV